MVGEPGNGGSRRVRPGGEDQGVPLDATAGGGGQRPGVVVDPGDVVGDQRDAGQQLRERGVGVGLGTHTRRDGRQARQEPVVAVGVDERHLCAALQGGTCGHHARIATADHDDARGCVHAPSVPQDGRPDAGQPVSPCRSRRWGATAC